MGSRIFGRSGFVDASCNGPRGSPRSSGDHSHRVVRPGARSINARDHRRLAVLLSPGDQLLLAAGGAGVGTVGAGLDLLVALADQGQSELAPGGPAGGLRCWAAR